METGSLAGKLASSASSSCCWTLSRSARARAALASASVGGVFTFEFGSTSPSAELPVLYKQFSIGRHIGRTLSARVPLGEDRRVVFRDTLRWRLVGPRRWNGVGVVTHRHRIRLTGGGSRQRRSRRAVGVV